MRFYECSHPEAIGAAGQVLQSKRKPSVIQWLLPPASCDISEAETSCCLLAAPTSDLLWYDARSKPSS